MTPTKELTPKEYVLDAIRHKNKATIQNALKHYFKLKNFYKKKYSSLDEAKKIFNS